ncbi:hypothetical protein S40285_03806 [Stachybotrys chlorohalonatus IBT 40285]|uniref:Uncharacterized protein n=1 Tax=Stachybotrys chlorohalonatus (strain IBT 40285) TaxID=1283841 RepID=A0A084QFR6_STAC4|nr:hypothetical protein S40285_03806 [Stachybotrys chlorohalonata IBT 40285]
MASSCGSICPVNGDFLSYQPNLGANAFLLAAFAVLVPVTFVLGLRFQAPVFATILTAGLVLEVVGFLGRVLLSSIQGSATYTLLWLLGTVLGPTFISASIFVVLPHTLSIYGQQLSPVTPFVAGVLAGSFIVAAAVLQLVGIIFLVFESRNLSQSQSISVIAAGLGLQTACHVVLIILHTWLLSSHQSHRRTLDPKHSTVYRSPRFSRFLRAMEVTTGLLLAYCIYRLVEMGLGVDGTVFQNQTSFMIMNGAIPLVSAILLTAFHPGAAFGSAWAPTSPRRIRRQAPPPLRQTYGYQPHHRYNPSLRSQITPTSQNQMRLSKLPDTPAGSPGLPQNSKQGGSPGLPQNPKQAGSPGLPQNPKQAGSPGLPQNPKPTYKPPSPRTPPLPVPTSTIDKRLSERSEPTTHPASKKMVDSEALW